MAEFKVTLERIVSEKVVVPVVAKDGIEAQKKALAFVRSADYEKYLEVEPEPWGCDGVESVQ